MSDDDTTIVDYDYAIVGGGVAGVYTAWRLLSAGKGSVCVFEGSNRIGGRLLSARPPGVEDMVAELGGMRYIPKVQPRVQALIDVLRSAPQSGDKPIDTFEFDVSFEENLAYTRGTHLRDADFTGDPDEVPYDLSFQERGKSVGRAENASARMAIDAQVPRSTVRLRRFHEPLRAASALAARISS